MASFSYDFKIDGTFGAALKALDVLDKIEGKVVKIAGKKIDFNETLRGVRELEAFNNVLQQSTDALLGVINKSAQMSDVMAITQKNTGLSNTEMQSLKSTIDAIDTRTATQDLLKMASVGGKLGVAKQDLQGFVRVIDKATVALGDEFGNDAERVATVLGKIRGQFKEFEGQSAESALSSIASAINYLGKQGANSAPVVAEFTQRVSTLGLSLAQSAGLGASLEELGLSAEIASGGLSAIMGLAATESSKFAQHLGLSRQAFEDLMNSNPNQVVLDLAKSFEQASDTQIAQQLKALGVSSQESVRVMKLLSTNTDLVSARQVAAAEQVRKKTDLDKENKDMQGTLAGQLARVQKRFEAYAVEIGNVLAPYAGLIQSTAFVSLGLSAIIPLVSGLGNLFISGTTMLFRYGFGLTVVNGNLAFTKTSLLGVIFQTGRWATMLLVQGLRSLALFAGRLVLMSAMALPALIASLGGASLATGIFNAVMAINPFVVIMIGIAALISGFVLLIRNFDSVASAVKWLWDFIVEYNPTSLLIKGFDKLFGTNVFGRIKNFFKTIGNWIGSLWGKISSFWDWMSGKESQKAKEVASGQIAEGGLQGQGSEGFVLDPALEKLLGGGLTLDLDKYTEDMLKVKGQGSEGFVLDPALEKLLGGGLTLDLNQRPGGGSNVLQGRSRASQAISNVSGGGSRPTTINIDFNSLVEQFTVYTSQGIAADDIERRVKEVLLRVVNGVNQIAGV